MLTDKSQSFGKEQKSGVYFFQKLYSVEEKRLLKIE